MYCVCVFLNAKSEIFFLELFVFQYSLNIERYLVLSSVHSAHLGLQSQHRSSHLPPRIVAKTTQGRLGQDIAAVAPATTILAACVVAEHKAHFRGFSGNIWNCFKITPRYLFQQSLRFRFTCPWLHCKKHELGIELPNARLILVNVLWCLWAL